MFDKFISQYMTKASDASKNVSEQLSQADQVSGGVEGVKKKYEVRMKKGGFVCRGQRLARSKKTRMY